MADNPKKTAEQLRDLAQETVGIYKDLGEQFNQVSRVAGLVADQTKQTTAAGQAGLKLEQGIYNVKKLFGKKQDDILEALFKGNKENKKNLNLTQKITEALAGQIPYGAELSKIFGEKAKSTAKIGAALAIATGILKSFTDLTKVIGDNFGAIGMQTPEIKNGLLDASVNAKALGFGIEDVASTVNELTTNFGFSLEKSIELSSSVLDTSKALGLSNTEGVNLIGTLSQVTGLSLEASTQFAKQTALLSKQSGVAPNVVLKDIAQSSESIAKFTDASGENIGKAAIMATKLGTNLNTVAGIAEGLLDFQSSIAKETEASVLLGRQLNFQKARELSLSNDIEGAMAAVVTQLGSEEEFTRLNAIQRKALAESIGVGVDQLAKFVNNQDKALTLSEKIASQKSFEELVGTEALDSIAQVVNQFKVIGAELVTTIGPSLSIVVSGIAGLVKGLAETDKLLPTIGIAMGLFAAKSLAVAASSIATAFALNPLIAGIGAAAGLVAVAALSQKIKTVASAQEGAITTEDGLMNVHSNEAILPIEMLGDFIADAMKPVVAAINKLNEDMGNKHVPTLAQSNIDGAKQSSKEVSRTFQTNLG